MSLILELSTGHPLLMLAHCISAPVSERDHDLRVPRDPHMTATLMSPTPQTNHARPGGLVTVDTHGAPMTLPTTMTAPRPWWSLPRAGISPASFPGPVTMTMTM